MLKEILVSEPVSLQYVTGAKTWDSTPSKIVDFEIVFLQQVLPCGNKVRPVAQPWDLRGAGEGPGQLQGSFPVRSRGEVW